jgi:hypothetical protein
MPLVSLIFRRTLAPSGAQTHRIASCRNVKFHRDSPGITEQLIHLNVAQARGVMSREILFMGISFMVIVWAGTFALMI